MALIASRGPAGGCRPRRCSGPSFRRSRLPEHHVRRPRLLQLLDQEVGAPITLIVAPAGAGKTVLVSSWSAESTVPTAWLSLDEADDDGPQLWSG